MPRYIIKLDTPSGPRYLEWSTIVDAPVTYGMTLEDFKAYYLNQYGNAEMERLGERLLRVESKGTSAHIYDSLSELLQDNRAGDDEAHLSKPEIIKQYCKE